MITSNNSSFFQFLLIVPLLVCCSFLIVPSFLAILIHFFFTIFPLFFSVKIFCWCVFKPTDSFLSHNGSTVELMKDILYFCYCFLIYNISFWFFFRVYTSLLTLLICSCILSTFSIRILSILTIVILNSFSDNIQTSALTECGYDAYFVSTNCAVCLLFYLVSFYWKLNMIDWIKRTREKIGLECKDRCLSGQE